MLLWSVQAGNIAGQLQSQNVSPDDVVVIEVGPYENGVWPTAEEVQHIGETVAAALEGKISKVVVIPAIAKIRHWDDENKAIIRGMVKDLGII